MNTDTLVNLFGLSGKVAVITDSGGLSSIDIAPLLADAGATVVLVDQYAEKGNALAQQITDSGGDAWSYPADIENEAAVIEVFEKISERFGKFDILVNCAGVTANQALLDTTLEQFDNLHSINTRSTFILMREAVRIMQRLGQGGSIVNITTMGTLHPVLNGNAAYAPSRIAVTGMSRSIALDHARDGIRVNCVLPGAIASKIRFHQTTVDAMASGYKLTGPATDDPQRRLPFGMGSGADIAPAVLYLASGASRYMTGESITLDGGFLLT